MREIADRAQASKETLYSWFGGKVGLFEQLISWQASRLDATLSRSLEEERGELAEVLRSFALELLRLFLGDRAIVINRAAIAEVPSDPSLAEILTSRGRDSVVPRLVRYLEEQRRRDPGPLETGIAAEALIGLTVGDQQVRRSARHPARAWARPR